MSDSQSPSPVIRSARVMVYDGPLGRISVKPHPTTGTIQPVGDVTITWCQIDLIQDNKRWSEKCRDLVRALKTRIQERDDSSSRVKKLESELVDVRKQMAFAGNAAANLQEGNLDLRRKNAELQATVESLEKQAQYSSERDQSRYDELCRIIQQNEELVKERDELKQLASKKRERDVACVSTLSDVQKRILIDLNQ